MREIEYRIRKYVYICLEYAWLHGVFAGFFLCVLCMVCAILTHFSNLYIGMFSRNGLEYDVNVVDAIHIESGKKDCIYVFAVDSTVEYQMPWYGVSKAIYNVYYYRFLCVPSYRSVPSHSFIYIHLYHDI